MEIITKSSIGDSLWRIENSKAKRFDVKVILFDGEEASYGDNRYCFTPESQCFATKEELLKYAADDGNESM